MQPVGYPVDQSSAAVSLIKLRILADRLKIVTQQGIRIAVTQNALIDELLIFAACGAVHILKTFYHLLIRAPALLITLHSLCPRTGCMIAVRTHRIGEHMDLAVHRSMNGKRIVTDRESPVRKRINAFLSDEIRYKEKDSAVLFKDHFFK